MASPKKIGVIATSKGYIAGAVKMPGDVLAIDLDQFSDKWMRPRMVQDAAAIVKGLGEKAPAGMRERFEALFSSKEPEPADPEKTDDNKKTESEK